MLIDLKHNFKKCESIFQFLNKMQLCSVSYMIYCAGKISIWCHHYCNIEGLGKCSIVFSLILENSITSVNLLGKEIWFKYLKNIFQIWVEISNWISLQNAIGGDSRRPSVVHCQKNYCISWEVELEDFWILSSIHLHSCFFVPGSDMFIKLFFLFLIIRSQDWA